MHIPGIGGPIPFNQPLNQPQKGESKADPTGIGVSFQNLLGLGKKRPDGTIVVPQGNQAGAANFNKSKSVIEDRRSQTDEDRAKQMAEEFAYKIARALQGKK